MTAEHVACQPENRLHDDVWCRTCGHIHIAEIPVVTYRCASDCGFGAWLSRIAEAHATNYPDHIVYGLHHQTVPIDERTDVREPDRAWTLEDEADWLDRTHAASANWIGYPGGPTSEEYRRGFASAAGWVRRHAKHPPTRST